MSSSTHPTIFIATNQQGTGIRYFFQTDIVSCLLQAGATVVCIVPNPDEGTEELITHFPGVVLEKLCIDVHNKTLAKGRFRKSWDTFIEYLCLIGMSNNINLAVTKSKQRWMDNSWYQSKKLAKTK